MRLQNTGAEDHFPTDFCTILSSFLNQKSRPLLAVRKNGDFSYFHSEFTFQTKKLHRMFNTKSMNEGHTKRRATKTKQNPVYDDMLRVGALLHRAKAPLILDNV